MSSLLKWLLPIEAGGDISGSIIGLGSGRWTLAVSFTGDNGVVGTVDGGIGMLGGYPLLSSPAGPPLVMKANVPLNSCSGSGADVAVC